MMLCPRCRRPLADQESGLYVCCADAPLRWQCAQCGKLSEGFALPYGRCPQCGGTLALREDEPRVGADAAALAAVRTAFEIELGGRAFYQRAAIDCTDKSLRTLFARFAAIEGEHMETLARRYHVEVPDSTPDFRLEIAALYAGVDETPQDPEALFRIAIALEKRAAAFFTERAGRAPADAPQRRLYEELAAEEHEHAELLASAYARWRSRLPALLGGDPMMPRLRDLDTDARLNAAELLLASADSSHVALECGAERVTYGELRDRVARAAGSLRARGLRSGQRVAIKLPDGIDWVVAWLGSIWAGLVAVGVNPRLSAPEWQFVVEEAGFSAIFAESDEDTPVPWRSRVIRHSEARAAWMAAQPLEAMRVDPDAPAFWLHTSGTSGKSKAVLHAHRCVREVGRIPAERLGVGPSDRLYASSKLFFAYPLANVLLGGLRLGATLILDPRWPTAQGVAEQVAASRPTVLYSVPSLYRNLLHEGLAAPLARSGLRLCVSAGEALPPSLRTAWREATGLPMVDGYGTSEALVLMLTAAEGEDGLRPSPGIEAVPLDPAAAAAGLPTRLLIRAATQALGYLDRPAAQADAFRDDRVCAADLFVPTDGGGWRFAGREDSLVKIRGRWVNLAELEERLGAGLAGVREGAAVCVPDADGVLAVAYFYVASTSDGAALRAALEERVGGLPHYQRPARLHEVDSLPRTPTGKLLRRKLAERLLQGVH